MFYVSKNMSSEHITIHLLICHDLSVESPGLNTLWELLGGLLELGEDVVDTGVVTCAQANNQMSQNEEMLICNVSDAMLRSPRTDGGGSSVVCVELLDVGHGEVGLQTDGAAEVHYRLVRLVYQQVDLY